MTPILSTALLRTQSDERLLRLVREGQDRAFDAIVDRYRKPLQRYCGRALSRSQAEDVVQQVLMNAWLALRDGTEVRSLRPWLYRIARTTMLDNAEAPGYGYAELERSLFSPDGPESELEQRMVVRKTLASVAALPTAQREALLRTAFDGQSRAQIAEALGVSEGAVRQLVHRARASLRAAATAVLPLPFVSWLASGSAGTVLESGATGSIGIAGIAKASLVLATAGAVVTGSGGVRNGAIIGAKKARAESAKTAVVHRHQGQSVVRAGPVVVHATPVAARTHERNNQGSRETDHGNSQARNEGRQGGDSGESARSSGNGEHQTARPDGERTNQPQADQPTPPEGGDSKPSGNQGDSSSTDSGSGNNGD